MKIIVVGDLHGMFAPLDDLIIRQKPDLILSCGDLGYWPKFDYIDKLEDIELYNSKLLWCDGNHEDHHAIKVRKCDEIVPNIIYMPRGSTYRLPDGRNILFMGGARSIDKINRSINIDFFPEETISYTDMRNIPDEKIDIVISHTCPKELLPILLKYNSFKTKEPSNEALSQILNIYNPKLWFFGHWHIFKTDIIKNTRWYCLSSPGYEGKWWMEFP